MLHNFEGKGSLSLPHVLFQEAQQLDGSFVDLNLEKLSID